MGGSTGESFTVTIKRDDDLITISDTGNVTLSVTRILNDVGGTIGGQTIPE